MTGTCAFCRHWGRLQPAKGECFHPNPPMFQTVDGSDPTWTPRHYAPADATCPQWTRNLQPVQETSE